MDICRFKRFESHLKFKGRIDLICLIELRRFCLRKPLVYNSCRHKLQKGELQQLQGKCYPS